MIFSHSARRRSGGGDKEPNNAESPGVIMFIMTFLYQPGGGTEKEFPISTPLDVCLGRSISSLPLIKVIINIFYLIDAQLPAI